eukprot:1638880-Pyramimonas_sp.AAC.1
MSKEGLGYVNARANLADGPSRGDLRAFQALGAQERLDWVFPDFSQGLDGWMRCRKEANRL